MAIVNDKDLLKTRFPELIKEWDFEKNISIDLNSISYGSGRKVWWRCKTCNRSYNMRIDNRVFGNSSCPYCSGRKVCIENSLGTRMPNISKQWHPILNGEITPYDVMPGTIKKFWWVCRNCGQDYERAPNSIRRDISSYETSRIYFCSFCSGRKASSFSGRKVCLFNCLVTKYPEIAKEWHPELNGTLTPESVTYGTDRKVWWLCKKCNESYILKISSKTLLGYKCPYCAGRRVGTSNCLATTKPEIAKEWHPTLNGNLTPKDVTAGGKNKAWWLCFICNKPYKARINNRTRDKLPSSCPTCIVYHREKFALSVIEKLTNRKFSEHKTVDWLVNSKTGRKYQIDGYNEDLNIILEHQGEQHCKQIKKFHPNGIQDFFYQLYKDADKYRLCKENNCLLICTYYNQTNKEMEEYIEKKLIESGKISR